MQDLAKIAGDYLEAWNRKDAAAFAALVAPEVRFVGPLARIEGRDAFVAALSRMFPMVERVALRALFAEEGGTRVVLIYDFVCAPPIGSCRTAEMLEVRGGLIVASELFVDSAPFTAAQTRRAAA